MTLNPIKKKINTIQTLNRKNAIDSSLALLEHSKAKKRLEVAQKALNNSLNALSECKQKIINLSNSDSFVITDFLELNQYFDLLESEKKQHQIQVKELTHEFDKKEDILKSIKIKKHKLEDIHSKTKLVLDHKLSQKSDVEFTEIWCSRRTFK